MCSGPSAVWGTIWPTHTNSYLTAELQGVCGLVGWVSAVVFLACPKYSIPGPRAEHYMCPFKVAL